jgi:outer membrane immunogenic protein
LLYVKGGAAAVKEEYHFQNRLVPAIFSTAQETRWGGALGLGVEFGITPNWSFGVEYNHLFLGKRDMTFDPVVFLGGLQPVTAMKHDPDVVTLRINYRFGGL